MGKIILALYEICSSMVSKISSFYLFLDVNPPAMQSISLILLRIEAALLGLLTMDLLLCLAPSILRLGLISIVLLPCLVTVDNIHKTAIAIV